MAHRSSTFMGCCGGVRLDLGRCRHRQSGRALACSGTTCRNIRHITVGTLCLAGYQISGSGNGKKLLAVFMLFMFGILPVWTWMLPDDVVAVYVYWKIMRGSWQDCSASCLRQLSYKNTRPGVKALTIFSGGLVQSTTVFHHG